LEDIRGALEGRVELLKSLFPFALALQCLKLPDLLLKDGSFGLEQEVVTSERHIRNGARR
jgi:hypothetical protein